MINVSPLWGRAVDITAGSASANDTINTTGCNAVIVVLKSPTGVMAHVRIGAGTQTATTADFPITGSSYVVIQVPNDGSFNNAAAIRNGATDSDVIFCPAQVRFPTG